MEAETRVPVVKTNPKYYPKINKCNFDIFYLLFKFFVKSIWINGVRWLLEVPTNYLRKMYSSGTSEGLQLMLTGFPHLAEVSHAVAIFETPRVIFPVTESFSWPWTTSMKWFNSFLYPWECREGNDQYIGALKWNCNLWYQQTYMTCSNFIYFHLIKVWSHYICVPWDSKVIVWGCTVRRVVIDNQHSFGSKNFTSLVISIWCKSTDFYDSNCPYFTTITNQVIILVCLDQL